MTDQIGLLLTVVGVVEEVEEDQEGVAVVLTEILEVEGLEIETSMEVEWKEEVVEEVLGKGQLQGLLKQESVLDMKEDRLIQMPMGTRLLTSPMNGILHHSLLTKPNHLIGVEVEVVTAEQKLVVMLVAVVVILVQAIWHLLDMIVQTEVMEDTVLLLQPLIIMAIHTNLNIMKVHLLVMDKAENILANHVQDIRFLTLILLVTM